MVASVTVRPARASDDVSSWICRSWGDTVMAVHDRLYDVAVLPALVAVVDGEGVVGVLTYQTADDGYEIVSCDAEPPGQGAGGALVQAFVELAREQGASRVWCTTTNDNLAAIGFWQSVGFNLLALRPGAVERARRFKPTIPSHGYRGLPIRDELDLERVLTGAGSSSSCSSVGPTG